MKVAICAQPHPSHLGPLVALGRALLARGHEVLLASGADPAPLQREGFEVLPLPTVTISGADIQGSYVTVEREIVMNSTTVFIGGLYQPTAHAPAAVAAIARFRPDLVLYDDWEATGPAVADALGIPRISHMIGNFPPEQALDADLVLVPGPKELLPRTLADLPQAKSYLPFPVTPDAPLDFAWPAGPGGCPAHRKTVFLTFGTLFNTDARLWRAAISALAALPINLVVGPVDYDVAQHAGPLPPHVRVLRGFIPHRNLFASVDVAVHHSPLATTTATLAAGKPIVAVPCSSEGMRTALILCNDLHAGLWVWPKRPDHENPLAEHTNVVDHGEYLGWLVTTVLFNPACRRNAERLAAQIRALPGVETAADWLEDLAATGPSPVRYVLSGEEGYIPVPRDHTTPSGCPVPGAPISTQVTPAA